MVATWFIVLHIFCTALPNIYFILHTYRSRDIGAARSGRYLSTYFCRKYIHKFSNWSRRLYSDFAVKSRNSVHTWALKIEIDDDIFVFRMNEKFIRFFNRLSCSNLVKIQFIIQNKIYSLLYHLVWNFPFPFNFFSITIQ